MPELPINGMARAARLAAIPAGFVGRRVWGLGRRVAGRPAEMIAAEVQARTAEQLFATLGELKGGAMKAGQWMSAMQAVLPEQFAGIYGQALTRLQSAAPAMPTPMMHTVMSEEFGQRWRARFAEFDDAPVAAASIGQIHRAVWPDNRRVAVKVQYPRAGDALATDLRQLDRLVPLLRVAVPGLDARELFAQLHASIMAEVDYRQEAAAQGAFAEAFADDQDVVVPMVVDVSDRVLVSQWIDATPLSEIIDRGTEHQRNRAALVLTRFLLASPSRVGRLHGDPHPGNFGLLEDGRLVVLDFGSTLPMPHGWPARLGDVLREGRDKDTAGLFSAAKAAGLVGDDVKPPDLLALVDPLLEPLRHNQFTFTRDWLHASATRVSDPRNSASRTQRRLRMSAEHLLVQRVAVGTAGVLSQLQGTVPVAAEAATWIPGLGRLR